MRCSLVIIWLLALGVVHQHGYGQAQNRYFLHSKDNVAFSHIRSLKQGVLLVRLHTNEHSIEALEQRGRHRDAQKLRDQQRKENLEIIRSFRYLFSFCEVRFFLSYYSYEVANDYYEGIFVNDSLELDSSITIPTNEHIYIADFGDVHFQAFGSSVEGVVVMDRHFEALERPFPYYVRKRSGLTVVKRSDGDMVKVLQENLSEFYGKSGF